MMPPTYLHARVQGAAYEAFKAVGTKTEDVTFVQTTSEDVAKAAGLTAAGSIAAIKNHPGGCAPRAKPVQANSARLCAGPCCRTWGTPVHGCSSTSPVKRSKGARGSGAALQTRTERWCPWPAR